MGVDRGSHHTSELPELEVSANHSSMCFTRKSAVEVSLTRSGKKGESFSQTSPIHNAPNPAPHAWGLRYYRRSMTCCSLDGQINVSTTALFDGYEIHDLRSSEVTSTLYCLGKQAFGMQYVVLRERTSQACPSAAQALHHPPGNRRFQFVDEIRCTTSARHSKKFAGFLGV